MRLQQLLRTLLAPPHLLAPASGDVYGIPSAGARKEGLRRTRRTRHGLPAPQCPEVAGGPASRLCTAYEPRSLLVMQVVESDARRTRPPAPYEGVVLDNCAPRSGGSQGLKKITKMSN